MTIDGENIQFSTDNYYSWRWFDAHCKDGIHEGTIVWTIKHLLDPGDVFYDIGANIGYFGIVLSKLFDGRIEPYFFEPHPKNFEVLKKNLQLSHISNEHAIQAAVSNSSGEENYHLGKGYGSPVAGISSDGESRVQTISLESYLQNHPIPDVIKIDVEGHEPDVIEGIGTRSIGKITSILFETHDYSTSDNFSSAFGSLRQEYDVMVGIEKEDSYRKPVVNRIHEEDDLSGIGYVLATNKNTSEWMTVSDDR
jgi:FkbM family methyltransferase